MLRSAVRRFVSGAPISAALSASATSPRKLTAFLPESAPTGCPKEIDVRSLNHETVVGSPLTEVFAHIAGAIAAASQGALQPEDIVLSQAPAHTGADLAFPCFPLARAWKKNPAQIAQEMAPEVDLGDALAAVDAAGPYLNLRLARTAGTVKVLQAVNDADGAYGGSTRQQGEVVMMEYVSPNTNKPLHLGHVRNAVLGRCVARLVESQGAKVHLSDIINDRGIHIAKSMMAYQRFGNGETPASTGEKGDHFVGRYYVKFDEELRAERKAWLAEQGIDQDGLKDQEAKKVEENFLAASPLMSDTREMLRAWEAGDEDVRALWKKMNSWVYEGFNATFDRLGIDFDKHYYESDIYQGGREIILDALERGVFDKAENGAVLAPLSKHGKLNDKVVLRADGTGLYITQDINLASIKFAEYGLTKSLYCVGSEQNYYFQQLKATLKLLGFDWADGVEHLSYGMVYLPDGKMKSREGTVVDADELMVQVTAFAANEVRERDKDGELADDEVERRAEAIGLAALVYEMLTVGRETDIQFDPKKSVAFKGETGPYLQYAYARSSSMLRKAGDDWTAPDELVVEDDETWLLVRALLYYPTVVADAAEGLDPSRLTSFLIEASQAFNNEFYNNCRVVDAEEPTRSTRLAILQAFRAMLGHGLRLLAIDPLDKM